MRCLSAMTTAAKRAQSVHPGRCRAASATSVAEEASPSSTTDSVRRVRRHVARPVALNWFRCVPASAGSRSRAGGAGEARNWRASRWFRTWSSAPPEPRLNESPRARAPRSPGVADGRCRGSSTDESRSSPLVELEIPLTTRRSRLPTSSISRDSRSTTLASVDDLLAAWYCQNGRSLPWRETRDPYAILVSEVMLQQTQVERVIPRWLAWLERWPTPVDARRRSRPPT